MKSTRRKIYFAVFEPTKTGYSIYFPDFPGCISVSKDIPEGIAMAQEALSLHYGCMVEDGDLIPEPTLPPFVDMSTEDFVVPVEIFPRIYDLETKFSYNLNNKKTRKTLTIPTWLNVAAKNADINFSQFVQQALKAELGMQ
ncbi:MAG: type II toxin-antitoxin system HicB family antitoxin [Firmicutes bacterium]|nr:type II toxin-antitoxin system HicB family antitoxin [Bacillota bacterium]